MIPQVRSPVVPAEPARILLVGMMGSGTSTVGRLLAERLGVQFSGNDAVLRERVGEGPGTVFVASGADVPGGLRDAGVVVWLRAEAQAHASTYADVADVTVDVDDLSPWRVAQRVLNELNLAAFGWLPGPYQSVVLDLDGLLVDTEVLWEEAKRMLYADRGIPFNVEDHRAVLGTSEAYTVGVFARRFGVGAEDHAQILRDYLGHATRLFAEGVPTRGGALELVASLQGRVPLGLASNTRREIVEDTLGRSGLEDVFDVIVTGDEVEPKPAPDIYLEACRQLRVQPGSSVAVEDSPTGVRAAKAAGLTCIGVPSDPDNPLDEADRVATSLLELIEPGAGGLN